MELANKRVLVTGASSGIGAAIAVAFAQKGAIVLVHYRRNDKGAQETLGEVGKYSSGRVYQADLSLRDRVKDMFSLLQQDGGIDILVNNAGDARPGKTFDERVWEYEYKNIFLSALYATEEFLTLPSTTQRKIINITSLYGSLNTSSPDFFQYSATKAALANVTVNLAKLLGKDVLVNGIAPGYTATPSWKGTPEEEKRKIAGTTTIDRFIDPYEIAHTAVFLAENDAMTGQIITVDGGASLVRMP